MKSERARLGIFLHLIYLLVIISYCVYQLRPSPAVPNKPQVLSAQSYYDESSGLLNSQELEVFKLVNEERGQSGLPPLKIDPYLVNIARSRAKDMATLGYYSHKSPSGTYYYDLLGGSYTNKYSCENLELEFAIDSQLFINKWMGSDKHRDCLLSPLTTDTGYAIANIKFKGKSAVPDTYVLVAINAASPK